MTYAFSCDATESAPISFVPMILALDVSCVNTNLHIGIFKSEEKTYHKHTEQQNQAAQARIVGEQCARRGISQSSVHRTHFFDQRSKTRAKHQRTLFSQENQVRQLIETGEKLKS